jgi:cell division septation protein DedD
VPRNDDGQFELILGNRQVLSVFFIVVILLGVFFTVGYIVGRNSAPVVTADSFPPRTDARPLVVDSGAAKPGAPEKEAPKPAVPESPKPVVTASQQPAEPERTPPPSPAPKPEAARSERAAAPEEGRVYLQLSATLAAEAETYIEVLRKRGFQARTAPVPDNATLHRVLVGPLAENEVNKVRADLQSAGFPGDKALRRRF